MTKDEALEMAFEALKTCGEYEGYSDDNFGPEQRYDDYKVSHAIAAIEEVLEQPEKEPGVTTYKEVTDTMNGLLNGDYKQAQMAQYAGDIKLFHASPKRPWVGLTDAEIDNLNWGFNVHDFVRAIEAKLKEKNT